MGTHSDPRETREKRFRNGDYYIGGWASNSGPEGEGLYTWADGSSYEGTWHGGQKHGVGKHTWPSGATYQGEWKNGFMHGVGTYEAPNGARYQGSWSRDVKQGLGKHIFSSGDVYEGIWRAGLPEGPGRYKWATGCEYDGEWRKGHMHGQGTFLWATGCKFDGEWKDGLQEGLGLFWARDSSLYDGMWAGGCRHGVGIFRPSPTSSTGGGAGPASALVRSLSRPVLQIPGDSVAGGRRLLKKTPSSDLRRHALSSPEAADDVVGSRDEPGSDSGGSPERFDSAPVNVVGGIGEGGEWETPEAVRRGLFSRRLSATAGHPFIGVGGGGATAPGSPVGSPLPLAGPERSGASLPSLLESNRASIRCYHHGHLLRESKIPLDEADKIMEPLRQRTLASSHKTYKVVDGVKSGLKVGKTIREGHQSYNVMLNLQLGIRYSVGRINTEPAPRELPPQDFELKVKQYFPHEGSDMTPVHASDNFMWKDYAPMVFRKLREIFGIDAGQYTLSLCSDAALRLLNTPGKSGAVFFLSQDDQFFVKTLKKGETKLLFSMLPEYYKHVMSHPHTLLTKFYGLHRITTANGRKFDMVVMANLFNTKVLLHRKFDLKGSTLGRTAGVSTLDDPIVIYKDLDLTSTFQLDKGWHDRLMYQLKADCSLLESCDIMDYSLLLGIHYPKRQSLASQSQSQIPGPSGGSETERRGAPSFTVTNDASTTGAVRNFDELDDESRFKAQFPLVSEKVARLKLHEHTKADLLQLVTVHLKGGTRHQQQQQDRGRQGAPPMASPSSSAARRASEDVPSFFPSAFSSTDTDFVAARSHSRTQARSPDIQGLTAEELALRLGQSRVQLGVNLPALCLPHHSVLGGMPEEVVLYFGIIDILQSFNPSKRIEHRLKSLLHDSHSISVTNPHAYAQRFQAFIKKVFQ